MQSRDITHCVTMGRRPDLLTQTLASLSALPSLPVLAINDFGDPATNAAFAQACPQGRRIDPGQHLGHHAAVDALYRDVTTPYIFHNEDDWQFGRADFLDDGLRLLEAEPEISAVCFRGTGDMWMSASSRAKIVTETRDGIAYERLDRQHAVWHGYTFNPHLIRRSLWEEIGGFARFANEREVSGHMRGMGLHVAFVTPGACRHIGDERSTVGSSQSPFKRLRNWARGIRQAP